MKIKPFLIILFIGIQTIGFAQNYNNKQLKTVAEIWGQCYLFHPSIIRADKNIEWEKELVQFLPELKKDLSQDEFINLLNSKLLSYLNDPLTCVQKSSTETNENSNSKFQSNENYDYYLISKDMLESPGQWTELDSMILDKDSQKPLVVDLRINSELEISPHEKSYFDNLASILIDESINLGSAVSREHFGWDEFNDWWYYEQRWKTVNNGSLNPLKMDAPIMQYQYPEMDLNSVETIHRPVYFIVNKSFVSYYEPLLNALHLYRPNTFIVFQNTGKVFAPWYSNIIKYDYDYLEFILNPTFIINHQQIDLNFDYTSNNIDSNDLIQMIKNGKSSKEIKNTNFSFDIIQKSYPVSENPLTNEERILGIIKTWTIVKYFYVHQDLASVNWDDILEPYLEKAQTCNTDKEYFELIKNMMSGLNDSHVSTYHPSIFDYSKLFIAPVQFEWIENKVIISDIFPEVKKEFDIQVGDEIVSIDEKSIQQIINDNKKLLSSSNDQSFYNNVINPGNFVDAPDVPMKITTKRNNKEFKLIIPRTVQIFEFFMQSDKRPASEIMKNDIGYLNLSALNDSHELENQLREMQNTKGLILDLRNGYPTDDYSHFLEMLTNKPFKGRIEKTPIVFANKNNSQVIEITQSEYRPDSSFIYHQPIAVLIDKSMVSRPEDIAIELKEIKNVFFVGEQTQGTDGEMTKISLPGGGETSFTGQVIKFANGDQFQGVGISPDYKVEKTVEGVKKGKDEILDEALEIINKKISIK